MLPMRVAGVGPMLAALNGPILGLARGGGLGIHDHKEAEMGEQNRERLVNLSAGIASRRSVLGRVGAGGLAAAIGLALDRGLVQAQGTPSSAAAPIATAWAAAWTSHDSARVAALYTADGTLEDVAFDAVIQGPDEVKIWADGFFQASPDLTLELTSAFQADDWAAAEWVWSGTDRGIFPEQPATGKHFSVRGATIFAVQDGKIRHDAEYYNLVTFPEQLGVIPEAGTPEP